MFSYTPPPSSLSYDSDPKDGDLQYALESCSIICATVVYTYIYLSTMRSVRLGLARLGLLFRQLYIGVTCTIPVLFTNIMSLP